MNKKIILTLIALAALLSPLVLKLVKEKSSNHFTSFEGVSGPVNQSRIPPQNPTDIKIYEKGANSRMAVLVTDKKSNWLDLIKGFKSIGIPITVTTDYKKALEHQVIFIYPYISGAVISEVGLKALNSHPANGGTLLAVNVLGGGLQKTFGFNKIAEGQNNKEINFSKTFIDMITPIGKTAHLNDQSIYLANKKDKSILITSSYEETTLKPLATFENNQAAITQNHINSGHAYAFGIDLGQLFYIGYSNREEDIARTYVNHYEPAIDLFLRFIKNAYMEGQLNAVTIGSVASGKELSIILSHDVDYSESVKNSLEYSQLEKSYGFSATYFLQVKYIKDFNDKVFFDNENIEHINQVIKNDMEIGSHGVSHSSQYSKFPIGDGSEIYPDYRPFVVDKTHAKDGTVLGELRVSKFLIENRTLKKEVVSFRPGELSNPYSLPQALLATGFKYSSSATANNSLTHLPFQLSYDRKPDQVLPIYEFPVTIEDEEISNMLTQIPEAISVSEAISNYGGLFVILIHPNVTGHKLGFQKKIMEHWKNRAWFTNLETFGDWWAKRDLVEVDIRDKTLFIDCQKEISNLTFSFPKKMKFEVSDNIEITNNFLLVKSCKGLVNLKFY